MVKLEHLEEIMELDIRGLDEIIAEAEPRFRSRYNSWEQVEQRIIGEGKAPSLSAYLLYEYQFNDRSLNYIAKEVGKDSETVRQIMKKMGIPIKTISESTKGLKRSNKSKKNISRAAKKRFANKKNHPRTGNPLPELTRQRISRSNSGRVPTQEFIDSVRERTKGKYSLEGHTYDSRQEAAVGTLLDKYVPGYSLVEGKTFQANGDTSCLFDFVLLEAIVEWHPIITKYDASREDYEAFKDLEIEEKHKDIDGWKDFSREYANELAVEYWMRRQEASDNSQVYNGREVILARNFNEFYDDVLSKYGENLPSKPELRREFKELQVRAQRVEAKRKVA